MTAIVYVDGFNLYYGALKGTPYKWLDLPAFCRRLLPHEQITQIRYFTARVKGRPDNPDVHIRQDAYLRVLGACPDVSIHYGRFLVNETMATLAAPAPGGPRCVKIIKTEEKGTDVNLGTLMLLDALDQACDLTVMIGNDSDLVMPLDTVKNRFGNRVGLINPQRKPSFALLNIGMDFVKSVRPNALSASQFPTKVAVGRGTVTKPATW